MDVNYFSIIQERISYQLKTIVNNIFGVEDCSIGLGK
jgi:hypothetical protein